MTSEKTPTAKEWEAAERKATRGPKLCSVCATPGHNLRTCPELLKRSR